MGLTIQTFAGHASTIEWTTIQAQKPATSDVKTKATVREDAVELHPRAQSGLSGDAVPVELDVTVKDEEPVLSQQQQTILERILQGENYFFTGSAGTGKSVLLRAIIKGFKKRHAESMANSATAGRRWQDYLAFGLGTAPPRAKSWNLGVTASTGMAGV